MNGGEIKVTSKKIFVGGPIFNVIKDNGFDEDFLSIHSIVINELLRFGFQVFRHMLLKNMVKIR